MQIEGAELGGVLVNNIGGPCVGWDSMDEAMQRWDQWRPGSDDIELACFGL